MKDYMNIKNKYIILDTLDNGVMIIDVDLNIIFLNRWFEVNAQMYREDVIGKNISNVFRNINSNVLKRKIKASLQLETTSFYDASLSNKLFPIKRNNVTSAYSEYMHLQISIVPYDMKNNQVIISFYDVSESYDLKLMLLNEIEKNSILNKELQTNIQNMATDIDLISINSEGLINKISKDLLYYLEYKDDELTNKSIFNILKHTDSSVEKKILSTLNQNNIFEDELCFVTKSGNSFCFIIRIIPSFNNLDKLEYATIISHDIAEETKTHKLLYMDKVTNIYNRRKLDSIIDKKISSKRKNDKKWSLAIIRFGYFKNAKSDCLNSINLLIKLTNKTLELARLEDTLISWSENELMIILDQTSLKDSLDVTKNIYENLKNHKFSDLEDIELFIGTAYYNQKESKESIINRTYNALYAAINKNDGSVGFVI